MSESLDTKKGNLSKQCKTGATLCECKQMFCARLEFTALIPNRNALCARLQLQNDGNARAAAIFHNSSRAAASALLTQNVFTRVITRESCVYDVLPDAWAKLNYSNVCANNAAGAKLLQDARSTL